MTPEDIYLHAVINRHRAPDNDPSPHRLRRRLEPLLRSWAGDNLESVTLSGSHAKGTALRGGDVDLFLSLSPATPGSLAALHASLTAHFLHHTPQPRNVSLRIRFDNTNVDLVPGRRREDSTNHTLWQLRTDTWIQTNIAEQIRFVRSSNLADEILALKIWRHRHALRFPSFYLELSVIHALSASPRLPVSASFLGVLHFLSSDFPQTRLPDPANSNNVVSDLLTAEEKYRIAGVAQMSLQAPSWPEIL